MLSLRKNNVYTYITSRYFLSGERRHYCKLIVYIHPDLITVGAKLLYKLNQFVRVCSLQTCRRNVKQHMFIGWSTLRLHAAYEFSINICVPSL